MFIIIFCFYHTCNSLERIALSIPTNMIIVDHMTFRMETPRVGSGYSLENEFAKLIYMNP